MSCENYSHFIDERVGSRYLQHQAPKYDSWRVADVQQIHVRIISVEYDMTEKSEMLALSFQSEV